MASHTEGFQQQEEEPNELAVQQFRERLSDIGHQSSISFLGTICTLLVGYLFRVYLARTLGAKLLGWNALGIGVYAICRLVGDLGLPYAAARYTAVYSSTGQADRLRTFFWRALAFSLLGASTLCFAVIAGRERLAVHFFHDPELSRYLPLYAILIPVGTANSFVLQCLTGLKKASRRTTITQFISFPFMMVMTVVALKLGLSLWGYVFAQIMGEMLAIVLAMWTILRSGLNLLPAINVRPQSLHQEEWGFALSMLVISLLEFTSSGADRLILGHFIEAKKIGVYAVASSVAALCALVLQSINTIFGPIIADLHAQDAQQLLLRLYQTITKWVIALTLPLILVFIIYARVIMGVFGPEFQEGGTVLAVLSAGQVLNIGVGSVGYLLFMSGNQRHMIPVQIAVASFVLIANVTLIPILGIMGAAIVSSLGVALTNGWFLAEVRKRMKLFPYTRSHLKLILPSMVTAGAMWLMKTEFTTVLPRIPLLFAVFAIANCLFFATFFASGLTDDDRIILQIVRGRLRSLSLPGL